MKKIFSKKFYSKKGGYTIIETMIAISLFIIIVMMGMGALLNANLLHQKSQNLRSVLDNLNFVMEEMSRNLRTGYNYQCFDRLHKSQQELSPDTLGDPRSCPTDGWAIAFETTRGVPGDNTDQWAYYIGTDSAGNMNGIFKTVDGAQSFISLTPAEITIDPVNSTFEVLGAEPPPGDTEQPFVTIKLSGTITLKNIVTPFSLETSVSQRQIDI